MSDARDQSGAQLVYLLRSLSVTGDVLYVGAHPDDEENGLVALLAHHHGVRVVYWSATRGEGGQSRVCPYRGNELGVYRTWESLAARAIDGGESLFGPFYDYDFSKNGAEALEKWGERRLVREIVRAIRLVQPQIVISRWRGDVSDGHGHHAAVGAAAKEAFGAAGDPDCFPELARIGLAPWQPRKLYQSMMGDWQPDVELGVLRPDLERDGCLRVNTGGFDPISRLTYQEQGALALNEHLTQGVGNVPTLGDFYIYLRLAQVASGSDLVGSTELFEGVDRTLTGLADYPGDGAVELRSELGALKELATAAADGFRVDEPWHVGSDLLELVRRSRELEGRLDGFGLSMPPQKALEQYLKRKRADAEAAVAYCLGLRLDTVLDRAHLTPGESVRMECRLWNYGPDVPTEIVFRPNIDLEGAEVHRVDDSSEASAAAYELTVPADAALSCPYWLQSDHGEYVYEWPEVPHAGQPFDPPLVAVTCAVRIADHSFELTRPVLHSQFFVGGYRELPPSILPPISAQPRKSLHILRVRDVHQVLELNASVVGHHTKSAIEGVLEVHVPEGWAVEPQEGWAVESQEGRAVEPAQIGVALEKAGDADSIPVRVTVPANAPPGAYEIRYGIRCFGRLYDASMTTVMQTAPGLGGDPDEATCVREQFIARPAVVTVDLIDVDVHEEHSYGYVTGTGDEVPALLQSLGLKVHALSDDELSYASLDTYDTIVIGPNAYLVRDALRKAAQRLLKYVHAGGNLVVQYQGYAFEHMGATPFRIGYNQPHDRITHENSAVRLVEPDHVVFRFPNEITTDDFSDWVRDRGMYFFGDWDSSYEALLGCADPGEDEKLGGLLIADYGRGTYVYCGYTLFRQLAAGVRGPFRLFSNLLAIPEARIRQRMEHLRGIFLFADWDDQALHEVAEITSERLVSDGEYLFHEGDEGKELFLIASGSLDILQGEPERKVGTCAPGVPVGELAALTGLRRSASLKARSKTHLFVIHSDDFLGLLRDQPSLSDQMIQLLARRLRDALTTASRSPDGTPILAVYE